MALRVNSSSTKVVLSFAAVAAFGLATAFFFRSHGNAAAKPTAPSLAQKDVSVIRSLPGIGRAVNYFFPMKAAELPVTLIGSSSALVDSVDKLTLILAVADTKKEFKEPCTLIIYGNHLQIVQDPGILALNPMKLILVGAKIVHSTETSSLEQCMINNGWLANENGVAVFESSSVDEAVKSPLTIINPNTTKPMPMVHYVKA